MRVKETRTIEIPESDILCNDCGIKIDQNSDVCYTSFWVCFNCYREYEKRQEFEGLVNQAEAMMEAM